MPTVVGEAVKGLCSQWSSLILPLGTAVLAGKEAPGSPALWQVPLDSTLSLPSGTAGATAGRVSARVLAGEDRELCIGSRCSPPSTLRPLAFHLLEDSAGEGLGLASRESPQGLTDSALRSSQLGPEPV